MNASLKPNMQWKSDEDAKRSAPMIRSRRITDVHPIDCAVIGIAEIDSGPFAQKELLIYPVKNLDFGFWLTLITSLSIFSAIMFLLIPRIAKWFFSKLDSEKTSQYIFVLSVLFFSAFLAEVAGVEGIIGAFVAGLVLNRLIPTSSILMNRIEFIGNSLFIPFFLIFVGMVVDYRAFFNGTWPLIIAGVLTAFAIFSKWLAALVTQWIFKKWP